MSEYTHQTKGRRFCRVVKVEGPDSHPDIEIDPTGFRGARIRCHNPTGGQEFLNVRLGDFILINEHGVFGVLSEREFYHRWERIGIDDPRKEPS